MFEKKKTSKVLQAFLEFDCKCVATLGVENLMGIARGITHRHG